MHCSDSKCQSHIYLEPTSELLQKPLMKSIHKDCRPATYISTSSFAGTNSAGTVLKANVVSYCCIHRGNSEEIRLSLTCKRACRKT